MSAAKNAKAGIKPEVLAAITAAIALYGFSAQEGYHVSKITKGMSPWRRAGLTEMMLGRDMNRDYM
ncbi:MAG: hypothetical protein PHT62_00855 [Desulfotomaculaceae bacterium]|nr:hypothetical protein [Desulfotomaculaceae bacterium]